MTATITPGIPVTVVGRKGFGHLLHAEWTKFRTVRGWVIAMITAALVTAGIALLDHSECGGRVTPNGPAVTGAGCSAPLGPGGEAVTDNFYFVHQPLAGDGSITARVTSLTGGNGPARLQPWSKAGVIIKASTQPGSAYAAMMVTAGHGVRMQYDYTGDVAGPAGAVSAASPRWLRLTRSGDTITGYDSADGTHWTRIGTATLAGLPATVPAGMFAASPGSSTTRSQSISGSSAGGAMTLATARFDHVSLSGSAGSARLRHDAGSARLRHDAGSARLRHDRPGGAWAGSNVGGGPGPGNGGPPGIGFRQAGGTITVTGSGDIAPYVGGTPMERTLLGAFGGLIAVIVVAAMFMTAEYRRGLIRVTLAASPGRGPMLAAKAVVIGSVTFIAGLAGAAAAVLLGEWLLRSNGNFIMPVGALTEVRAIAGTAALLAVAAVLALALGMILRHSAGAITAVIVTIVLPYLLAGALPVLPAGAADWLLRVTPAAAFAIQQTITRYPQVSASYTPGNGYYPLAPWAGFAVLCGYAVLALALAAFLIRRRDA